MFDPILNKPNRSTPDATFFREAQKAVQRTWIRYKERYTTAESVKDAFLADLKSETGAKLANMLQWLDLPRFEDIEREFLKLCRELEL